MIRLFSYKGMRNKLKKIEKNYDMMIKFTHKTNTRQREPYAYICTRATNFSAIIARGRKFRFLRSMDQTIDIIFFSSPISTLHLTGQERRE